MYRIPLLILLVIGLGSDVAWADLTPQQIRDAYHRSYGYERTGDYENAIKALSLVFREYPNGYTVNLRLGWLHYLSGKQANALEHYETAIRVAPYSLEAKLGALLPLMAQGRYAESETRAYQILTADYYNYFGNLRLAYTLRMQGKLDQAHAVLVKMLAAYPTDTAFLAELGLVLVGQGDKDGAAAVFSDVLTLDPENVSAQAFFNDGR